MMGIVCEHLQIESYTAAHACFLVAADNIAIKLPHTLLKTVHTLLAIVSCRRDEALI